MNSPTTPGQNRSGEKAAIRVRVDAVTGPAILRLASTKAVRRSCPSAMRRSAYSTTMMASSTNMPTARIRLNSTTRFTVKPAICRPKIPIRKLAGMANPIRMDERTVKAYRMTMNTKTTAVRTEFCRSDSSWRMVIDLSWLNDTSTPSGRSFCTTSVTARTSSTVSIRLAPMRFDTSIATAGLPSRRVMLTGSFRVGRISAMSMARTTAVSEATTGNRATSSSVSISEGTLMA